MKKNFHVLDITYGKLGDDVPINQASKLTISCIGDDSHCDIFIADAILYN